MELWQTFIFILNNKITSYIIFYFIWMRVVIFKINLSIARKFVLSFSIPSPLLHFSLIFSCSLISLSLCSFVCSSIIVYPNAWFYGQCFIKPSIINVICSHRYVDCCLKATFRLPFHRAVSRPDLQQPFPTLTASCNWRYLWWFHTIRVSHSMGWKWFKDGRPIWKAS